MINRFNYEQVLGINMKACNKATRLLYKETEMTHAMVLTAANVEVSYNHRHNVRTV